MTYLPTFLTLAGAYALGAISPGPNFMLVTSQAVISRAGALGIVLGFVMAVLTWSLMCLFGLRAVLDHDPALRVGLRIVGSLYLAYLGARMLLAARGNGALSQRPALRLTGLSAVHRGYLTNMTNPKAAAFFSSIFISVVPAGAPGWVYAAVVGIMGSISLGYYGSLALVFSRPRAQLWYLNHSRPIGLGCGGLLIALGLRLALAS